MSEVSSERTITAPLSGDNLENGFTDSGIKHPNPTEVKHVVENTKEDLVKYLVNTWGEEHEPLFRHTVEHLELTILAMGGVFLGATAGGVAYKNRDKIKEELKKL